MCCCSFVLFMNYVLCIWKVDLVFMIILYMCVVCMFLKSMGNVMRLYVLLLWWYCWMYLFLKYLCYLSLNSLVLSCLRFEMYLLVVLYRRILSFIDGLGIDVLVIGFFFILIILFDWNFYILDFDIVLIWFFFCIILI